MGMCKSAVSDSRVASATRLYADQDCELHAVCTKRYTASSACFRLTSTCEFISLVMYLAGCKTHSDHLVCRRAFQLFDLSAKHFHLEHQYLPFA